MPAASTILQPPKFSSKKRSKWGFVGSAAANWNCLPNANQMNCADVSFNQCQLRRECGWPFHRADQPPECEQLEIEDLEVRRIGRAHLAHPGGPENGRKLDVEDAFTPKPITLHPVEKQMKSNRKVRVFGLHGLFGTRQHARRHGGVGPLFDQDERPRQAVGAVAIE